MKKYTKEELARRDELVRLAKTDKSCLNALLEEFYKEFSVWTHGYKVNGYDKDDFYQEGARAFCNAVLTYDPEKQASFNTYVIACIRNRMKDLLKQGGVNKPQTFSLDDDDESRNYHEVIASEALTPEEKLLEAEDREEKFHLLKERLSAFEYEVFLLHYEGYNYEQIAELLSRKKPVTKKQVDNALQRIKLKCKG